jgi:acyl-CoA thioester hydrolase
MIQQPSSWRYRVYWEHTDAGGVVYHSRYLNFMERARSDWLLDLGFPQVDLRDRQSCLFVVTSVQLDFYRPARLEDELAVTVAVEQLRAASMRIAQQVRRQDSALLAEGQVSIACLNAQSFRPTRIPRDLHAAIRQFQGTE